MPARHHSLDWLKWLAVTSMCLDHLRFIPSPLTHPLFYIGRPAFPIFALLCGWNLILYSRRPGLFVLRVSTLAGIMAILQVLIFQSIWPANPIICLALGMLMVLPVRKFMTGITITGANLFASLGLALILMLSMYLPLQGIIQEGWAGIFLTGAGAICAGQAVKAPTVWKLLPAILVCGLLAAQLNGSNIYANVIAFSSTILALLLLSKNPLPPCPAPNNIWLYLAFPLSLLPAVIWQYWARG
jgi:hypothetical protein